MISENLLNLRKLHHFSQEDVAERVGVSRQAVAKWENGETIPDISNCCELAKLYDVTLDELVHYQSSKAGGLPIPPKGKYMFGTVTLGDRGQIVIPAKARKIFGLNPGDDLMILGDEDRGLALVKSHYILEMLNEIRQASGDQEGKK